MIALLSVLISRIGTAKRRCFTEYPSEVSYAVSPWGVLRFDSVAALSDWMAAADAMGKAQVLEPSEFEVFSRENGSRDTWHFIGTAPGNTVIDALKSFFGRNIERIEPLAQSRAIVTLLSDCESPGLDVVVNPKDSP